MRRRGLASRPPPAVPARGRWASVRRDGSSRFGETNRYGVFPAVSAAWNVTEESFFNNIDLVSHLKLRASWGQLGNQEIGIYPYSSLVETGILVYPFGEQINTGTEIVETSNGKRLHKQTLVWT